MKMGQKSPYYRGLSNVYKQHGFDLSKVNEMMAMESQAFDDALEKLDKSDRVFIKNQVKSLSGGDIKIKNLGEKTSLEVIAKLGIFLVLNQKDPKTS